MARIPFVPRRDARLERRDAGLEARRRRCAPRPPSPRRRAVGSRAPAPRNGRRACGVPHHRARSPARTLPRWTSCDPARTASTTRWQSSRHPRSPSTATPTGPRHELREEWEGLDVERDAWLVEVDGRVAGVAHLLEQKGAATSVTRTSIPSSPAEASARVSSTRSRSGCGSSVPSGRTVSGSCSRRRTSWATSARPGSSPAGSFEYARSFFRMVIDVTEPQPDPVWPDGAELRPLEPDRDGPMLHAAEIEAFSDEWDYVALDYDDVAQAGVRPERLRPCSRARRLGGRRGRRVLAELREAKRRLGFRRDARRPAGLATARARPRAAPRVVPAVSARPERRRSRSVSTWRTRPARRGSTSAPACTSSGRQTSGRRSSGRVAETALRDPRSA